MNTIPRHNSVVCYIEPDYMINEDKPFKNGEHLLFLGEIVNMPKHCIVVKKDGTTHWGWHTTMFVEIEE